MEMWSNKSAADKISAARSALINRDMVWWGNIALKMKPVPLSPEIQRVMGISTAAVDGVHLFYAPQFIDSLSKVDLAYVIAHEVMHVANLHHTRIGHREIRRWNIAADFLVNQQLIDAGMKMPADSGIVSSRYLNSKYKGWSVERIYEDVPDQPPQDGQQNNDPGGMGGVVRPRNPDGSALSDEARRILERTAASDVAAATKMAKEAGKFPASFEEEFPDPAESKVDWRQILPRFLQQNIGVPHDTTWAKPNRRFVHLGVYLPSMDHKNECELAIFIDTSGSMSSPEFAAALGETNSILELIRPSKIHLVQCDADIQEYKILECGEPVRTTIKGRGGTDFRPPFALLEEKKIEPHCCLYFTDLCGPFPAQAPRFPLLWCATTDAVAPFGETIRIEL